MSVEFVGLELLCESAWFGLFVAGSSGRSHRFGGARRVRAEALTSQGRGQWHVAVGEFEGNGDSAVGWVRMERRGGVEHRRRRGGRALKVAMFVLACVVGAVAAWCVSAYFAARGSGVARNHEWVDWPREVPADWPTMAEKMEEIRGTGVRAEWYTGWGPEPADDSDWMMYRLLQVRTGWPLPAFQYETTLATEGKGFLIPMEPGTAWESGLEMPEQWLREEEAMSDGTRDRRIPIRPWWPGLVVDVVLFVGVQVAVVVGIGKGVGAARRWWRRSKGLCGWCGYERGGGGGGGGVCPECGGA